MLPPELLDHILSLLPPNLLQATTHALLTALGPSSQISRTNLWRHLRITREGQSWQAAQSLRLPSSKDRGLEQSVRTIVVEAWREDAQLLINLLQVFPGLRRLEMTVGPLFAPENVEELLVNAEWKGSIESLKMRFNPYVMERSYYTFLKGTYFDITPLTLSTYSSTTAPNLKHLAFIQDLPPNHGVATKIMPAFGMKEVIAELEQIEEELPADRKEDGEKKDFAFAQPIVFFKLYCLTTLSLSPVGAQLTHLILRLPRRNLLPSLTSFPTSAFTQPLPAPFPNLTHLDLSTTHLLSFSPQLPLLLLLLPELRYLNLDRTTGLIGSSERDENSAILTLRWLGKCCGGVGLSRNEEAARAWRKVIKNRPTGVAAPGPPPDETFEAEEEVVIVKKEKKMGRSGFANMPKAKKVEKKPVVVKKDPFKSSLPPLIKDILFIPPPPRLQSLGLGLYNISSSTKQLWSKSFFEGYREALLKTIERGEENLARWETWERSGKLEEGNARLVTLIEGLEGIDLAHLGKIDPVEDPEFNDFLSSRSLISITPSLACQIINLSHALLQPHPSVNFSFCTTPDCPSAPGSPHLSLLTVSKEALEVRENREKGIWEKEERERNEWRRGEDAHEGRCAHLVGREVWG